MIWVCRLCSSNNDESATHCFVCGNERPAEIDLEWKREKRIEREKKFLKAALTAYKALFITALCVIGLCLAGLITVKALDRDMKSILDTLLLILKNAGTILLSVCTDNALAIGKSLIDAPITYVFKNFLNVMEHFGGNFKDFGLNFWETLKFFGGNFKDFGKSVAFIAVNIWSHIKFFWETLSETAVRWWSHLKDFGKLVKEGSLNIWEHLKDGWSIVKEVGLHIADKVKNIFEKKS